MFVPSPISIFPVVGLPEVTPGMDLARQIVDALPENPLQSGDVLVIAQKVISKAEDARVNLNTVQPSRFAQNWAREWGRDPRLVEVVLGQTRRIIRMERGLIISETHHGFVCANAGVDLSNTGQEETAILLPINPDQSAATLRDGLKALTGKKVGVIVSDTFGRPWRSGLTQVALGSAGLSPVMDMREQPDAEGRELHVTMIALADEMACAADLVCGKLNRVPVAVIRGYPISGEGKAEELIRPAEQDLFR